MKKIVMSFIALLVLPASAFAQATTQGVPNTDYIESWIAKLLKFGQQATTFLMIAATLYFIWTVIGYIREKDAKAATEKRGAMLRGIIGLFVIVGIWGIIRIISSTLGVTTGNSANINVPCPPGMIYSTTVNPPRCI